MGRQRTLDRLGRQFLQGIFDPPDLALKLALKDVTLATELARELGVPMRIANLTHAEMSEALNRGWGERDSRAPMLLQKERAGVEIKVPAEALRAFLDRDGQEFVGLRSDKLLAACRTPKPDRLLEADTEER